MSIQIQTQPYEASTARDKVVHVCMYMYVCRKFSLPCSNRSNMKSSLRGQALLCCHRSLFEHSSHVAQAAGRLDMVSH